MDFFSEEEIESFYGIYYSASDKFYGLEVPENLASESLKTFDTISFHFKKNDKNLKFFQVKGMMLYPDNIEGCLKKKKDVVEEIRNILTNAKESDYKGDYGSESDSVAYISDFKQPNGQVRVWCADWDKKTETEKGFEDDLNVSVSTTDFLNWIDNEAY